MHPLRSWRSAPAGVLQLLERVAIDRRPPSLGDAVLVGKDVALRRRSRALRVLRQGKKLNVPILHVLWDKHHFVLRGEEVRKEFRLNDDRHHDQQVKDYGDPYGFAPSRPVSLIFKLFNEQMEFGGILRQVGAQRAV